MTRRNGAVTENPTAYSTRRPRMPFCSVIGVQQVVAGAGAVGAGQQVTPVAGGDLGNRLAQDVDVVGGSD